MVNTLEENIILLDQALNQNKAVIVDWKASVWDMVEAVKVILPHLDIKALHEVQKYGDWYEPLTLSGTQHEIKVEIPNTIFDFFRILNQHLDNNHQTFVFLNTNDDNYNFILIFTEELPRYLEMGFEEI